MMHSSLVCWVWWSLFTILAVAAETTVASTTASLSLSRGWWGGRRSALTNATNSIPEDPVPEEASKPSRGFFFRPNSKKGHEATPASEQQDTTTSQKDEDDLSDRHDVANNRDSKQKKDSIGKKGSVGLSTERKDMESSSVKNITTSSERGRGPLGFFKPIEKLKKANTGEEETDASKATADGTSNTTSVATSESKSGNNTDVGPSDIAKENHQLVDDRSEESESTSPANTTQSTNATSLVSTTIPRVFVYKPFPEASGDQLARPMPARYGRGSPSQSSPFMPQQIDPRQALIAATVASLVNVASRLWLIVWIAKRLSAEEELIAPEQHFRWENLNDRYSRDQTVLRNILARPPQGFSRLRWGSYLKQLRPKKSFTAPTAAKLPTKSVIVVDITPSGHIDLPYLTDVVNFLVASHTKVQFGSDPEIVLLVESPGGGVLLFGLAAAQLGRLKQMGLNVTVCVDSVAASGGYMIAIQATKLLGAPFAQLGSIGVMTEGLNFNSLLTRYGVKPMVLKAGEEKNRLSAFGPVTDNDIREESKRLEKIHEAFVELCLTERSTLDPGVCDGTVMVAAQGLEHGLVDRVITSEEYIWECIQDGAHVLKLHKASPRAHPHYFLFRALDVLPHLKEKLQQLGTGKLIALAIQGSAFVGMVLRAIRQDF